MCLKIRQKPSKCTREASNLVSNSCSDSILVGRKIKALNRKVEPYGVFLVKALREYHHALHPLCSGESLTRQSVISESAKIFFFTSIRLHPRKKKCQLPLKKKLNLMI